MAGDSRKAVNGAQYLESPEPRVRIRRVIRRRIRRKSIAAFLVNFAVCFLVIGFIIAMAYVFVEVAITKLNWEINEQVKANEQVVLDNEKIRLEIAKKNSLDRIEYLATNDLGMVKAANIDFLIVSENNDLPGSLKEYSYEAVAEKNIMEIWLQKALNYFTLLKSQYIKVEKGVR